MTPEKIIELVKEYSLVFQKDTYFLEFNKDYIIEDNVSRVTFKYDFSYISLILKPPFSEASRNPVFMLTKKMNPPIMKEDLEIIYLYLQLKLNHELDKEYAEKNKHLISALKEQIQLNRS